MKILSINTVATTRQVILFDTDLKTSLAETSWITSQTDSLNLLPAISKVLKTSNITHELDIDGIFVVSGPGSFVAIRLACLIANSMAQNLPCKLFSCNTFDFLRVLNPNKKTFRIFAGGSQVFHFSQNSSQSFEIKTGLPNNDLTYDLEQFLKQVDLNTYQLDTDYIEPFYAKEPQIS